MSIDNKRLWHLPFGVLFIALLSGCSEPAKEVKDVVRPVKMFTVTDANQENLRQFPAEVYASEEADISFRISGELVEFPVKQADVVKKGQLLARLDDRDIKNNLLVRQSDYDLAKADFKRIQELRVRKVVSQSDLDNANARLKSTTAALEQAKDQLEYTTLKAPFAGRIAQTLVENFQFVQAKETILVLQSNNTLDISIQVPESIISKVRKADVDESYQPTVTFSSRPDLNYKATYKEHSTVVNPGTQSYTVVFTLPIPEEVTVYPGMGATLSIDMVKILAIKPQEAQYVLPLSAVLKDDSTGIQQVWLYNPATGTVSPKEVTVGEISQDGISITSGLEAGDQIVAAGLNRLRNGMKVKPLVRERGL